MQVLLLGILGVATGCLPETNIRTLDESDGVRAAASSASGDPSQSGSPGPIPTSSPSPLAGGGTNSLPVGALFSVAMDTGAVSGWAKDSDTPSQSTYIEFYVDGPMGSGTFAGTLQASAPRSFPQGPYGFTFQIPMNFRDAKIHKLYAYSIDTTTSVRAALNDSPGNFAVGTNTTGLNYFNNSVKPTFQSYCTSCHGSMDSYISYKERLINPTDPSKSNVISATENSLFDRAHGLSHGGGNRCAGGLNAAPCSILSQWWMLEFN